MTHRFVAPFLLGLLFSATAAIAGGPPRIAIERAAAGSREAKAGAAFVVKVEQCGTPLDKTVLARAEGVAGGKRQSVELGLVPTGTPGTYLLRREWPSTGTWVLRLSVDNHGHATLLARPTTAGAIPSRLLDRPATAAEIDGAAGGSDVL